MMSKCLAIAAILVSGLPAQDVDQLEFKVRGLEREARAAAPAFSADLLLRIATRYPTYPAREALIVGAFEISKYANLPPYPYFTVVARIDSVPRKRAAAPLNRLSIQTQAISMLLEINKLKARQLFNEISFGEEPDPCGTYLYPELNSYYNLFVQITKSGYTAAERAKALHLEPWRSHLLNLPSTSHLAPAMAAVSRLQLSPRDLTDLVGLLAARMLKLPVNVEAFQGQAASIFRYTSTLAGQMDPAAGMMLTASLRPLIGRYLKSEFCDVRSSKIRKAILETYNAEILPREDRSVTPLGLPDEVRLKDSRPSPEMFWDSPESSAFQEKVRMLKFAGDRENSGWASDYQQLASEIKSWTGDAEPSKLVFYLEKSSLLLSLVTVPGGDARRTMRTDLTDYYANQPSVVRRNSIALDALVAHISSATSIKDAEPSLWLRPLIELLDVAAKYRKEAVQGIFSALDRQTIDPVILAYRDIVFSD